MFCSNQRLVSAFKKAGFQVQEILGSQSGESLRTNGYKSEEDLTTQDRCSTSYRVVNGNNVVTWHLQDGKAICVHCGSLSNQRDIMTDYFPGSYARTIRGAVASLS